MLSLYGKQTHLINDIFVSESYKRKTLFKLLVLTIITLHRMNSGQDITNYSG